MPVSVGGYRNNNKRRSTYQIYIERRPRTSTPEYSKRLGKTPPERWGPPDIGQWRVPHLSGAGARRLQPIRCNLVDPASTTFEE